MQEQLDCVVIGAGVVGLAVARALALQGREVLVLEAAYAVGTETSSRNSEVIHAGMYYAPGSLKAALCLQGKALLYAYCAERAIAHQRCGKLIVATQAQELALLERIAERAVANGLHDLQQLSAAQACALEPALRCVGALLSPSTGIVDSHGVMLALQGDLENAGGMIALRSSVSAARRTNGGIVLLVSSLADGAEMELSAKTVINCAGLHAPDLARRFDGIDLAQIPKAFYARGNYFSLAGRAPFSRLIYPVPPVSDAAGLGVHLTFDLGGQARFGPDIEWVDRIDYTVDPARADAFYAQVRAYWPGLADGTLLPAYSGIRPKICGPGETGRDFLLQGAHAVMGARGEQGHGIPGLINLFGIDSPGLTSCLALGQLVANMARTAD